MKTQEIPIAYELVVSQWYGSISKLAKILNRDVSSLSRTLRKTKNTPLRTQIEYTKWINELCGTEYTREYLFPPIS